MELKPGNLDLTDPDLVLRYEGSPHDYLAMLRRDAPVCWHDPPQVPKGNLRVTDTTRGFWVISKYDDLVEISRDPQRFSAESGTVFYWDFPAEQLPMQRNLIINMDPPKHVQYRRLVQRGFTPQMVSKLEPIMRQHSREIVDRVARRGECEFVADVASELPLILICELMGIPVEDREKIFRWSNKLIGFDDPDMGPGPGEEGQAQAAMYMYCQELAEKKLAQPDDTLISKYLHGVVDGDKITPDELNQFFLVLTLAGNETTRNTTSNFMRMMFRHPDQFELLKSDVDRHLEGAVQEVLRYCPSVFAFRRTATEDTEIRGVRIAAGDKVYLSYPSANRDEDHFHDSMTFDITRNDVSRHLAFGIGEHYCLGANLAQMMLRCITREIVTRLPDMEPTEKPALMRGAFLFGVKKMPVRFTPER